MTFSANATAQVTPDAEDPESRDHERIANTSMLKRCGQKTQPSASRSTRSVDRAAAHRKDTTRQTLGICLLTFSHICVVSIVSSVGMPWPWTL